MDLGDLGVGPLLALVDGVLEPERLVTLVRHILRHGHGDGRRRACGSRGGGDGHGCHRHRGRLRLLLWQVLQAEYGMLSWVMVLVVVTTVLVGSGTVVTTVVAEAIGIGVTSRRPPDR